MFISNVRVENFKGFYGVHDFHFLKGLNVILGPCGEGKTNLCQAIEYGLFGGIWGPPGLSFYPGLQISNLVNVRHKGEHPKKYDFYDTSVEIHIVKGGETYRIERNLMFHGDGEAYEKLHYSTDIKLGFTRNVFHDLIHFNAGIPEGLQLDFDASLSAGERMSEYLEKQIERNIEKQIRMVVLDSALDRMAREKKKDFLKNIAYKSLEQIILLESPVAYQNGLEKVESKKYLLGATLEKINVSVENYPFQKSKLENELKWNLNGKYLLNGHKYDKQYDSEYSVEFTEAEPDGGRFSENKTKMTIKSS